MRRSLRKFVAAVGCSHLQAVLGSPPAAAATSARFIPKRSRVGVLTETSFTSWVDRKSTSSAACPLLVLFLQRGG